MKTVMIVEDEEMIRKGLCAMVSNARITVENIIECRNGADAIEVLRKQPVDVMITDIRMPKMDGVELVRNASGLPSPPIMIVVSGYSDFEYVTSVFKQGVRDYLLKPVERDRVHDLLDVLQAELDARSRTIEEGLALSNHILKSILLGVGILSDDYFMISKQCGGFFDERYHVVCIAPNSLPETDLCYRFDDMDGQRILLVPQPALLTLCTGVLKDRCAGISGAKNSLGSLREGYLESVRARKRAFVMGETQCYEDIPPETHGDEPNITAEQIARMIGAGKTAEAVSRLGRLLLFAQNKQLTADALLDFYSQLPMALGSAFAHIPLLSEELKWFTDVLNYESAFEYHLELCRRVERLSGCLSKELERRNVRRVREAIDYIREHFRENINMAVVSNHISMNYSQFSVLFKQYTGSSFSEYLRNLRLAESRKLLADHSLNIKRVGEMSGFSNEKHFMKCFKQETGVSPSDYRNGVSN